VLQGSSAAFELSQALRNHDFRTSRARHKEKARRDALPARQGGETVSSQTLLKNARVFDGTREDCASGQSVLIEDGIIKEVSASPRASSTAQTIDVKGLTLMPGMIDAHVHACASDVDPIKIQQQGEAYRTAFAVQFLGHALKCGFTTVRDVGGGSYSLARAVNEKLITGPRYFYAGRFLSMTGGHGDFRQQHEAEHPCSCAAVDTLGVIADGVDAVTHAAREELRRGAHCIKIMASGGVASPTDPIWMSQYREDEIRAVVHETMARRTYTAAHCHPAESIKRCAELGVRSIEHGTLIDKATADFVAKQGCFVVPTMVIIFALQELGRKLGLPAGSQEKLQHVFDSAIGSLEILKAANVKVGFGTDLLGKLYTQQCRELEIRARVFKPVDVLRQATSLSAELMNLQGRLGCVASEAFADLLVVDGDPLKDISVLAADGAHLKLIMRAGEIVKNEL
jgi:imidazolonepropionase-like amidohydrolase